MKKLKLWKIILLIIFYPIGIVWLCWYLSSKFPKFMCIIDGLWNLLAIPALVSIYKGPEDIAGIIFCAIIFVLFPFTIVLWGVLRYRANHRQNSPASSAAESLECSTQESNRSTTSISPVTPTPSKSKDVPPPTKTAAHITVPLSSLSSSKSNRDIDKHIRKLKKEQEDFWENSVNTRHFELLELEGQLYSKIHHSGDYHSNDAYHFEAVCKEDISLAEEFVRLHKKYNHTIPHYPCFKQLAIFYEKQGSYHLAITVCEEAIRLGFEDDGTKGGMTGRIEKLEKKLLNS